MESAKVRKHLDLDDADDLGASFIEPPEVKVEFNTSNSDAEIMHRVDAIKEKLYLLAEQDKRNESNVQRQIELFANEGKLALKKVIAGDDKSLRAAPMQQGILEAIVVMDGSRPSFLVKNGEVEEHATTGEDWAPIIQYSERHLKYAIAAVGRIDKSQTHCGTGFLIQKDTIITNRHVLEGISEVMPNGKRKIAPSVTINFGAEYGNEGGITRTIIDTVFYGNHDFNGTVNHNQLDLAILRLQPLTADDAKQIPLALNFSHDWTSQDAIVYTIGYPAKPDRLQYPGLNLSNLLSIFFADAFGYKRCAPGRVEPSTVSVPWTLCHDATTLAGSSGSLVVALDSEQYVAGLHYGGNMHQSSPKVNWAHIIGSCMEYKNFLDGTSLQQTLEQLNVQFSDKPLINK